jgi:hypothetical protein
MEMMMATIWKQELSLADVQTVTLPAGAEVLCAHAQFGNVCIWFRCDPMAAKEPRTFAICGTGGPAPDEDGRYIGTVFLGEFVWHVFERIDAASPTVRE